MKSQAYAKQGDASSQFYASQKKTLEINAKHPLVRKLKELVEANPSDETAKDLAKVLYDTATLRSSFQVKDTLDFAQRIEKMLRMSVDVDLNEKVEDEPEEEEDVAADNTNDDDAEEDIEEVPDEDKDADESAKDEL